MGPPMTSNFCRFLDGEWNYALVTFQVVLTVIGPRYADYMEQDSNAAAPQQSCTSTERSREDPSLC